MRSYSIWRVLAFLFAMIGILGMLFVLSISFFFYQFNLSREVEQNIVTLDLVANTIAGPSWTVKETYPGVVENTLRGVMKIDGIEFMRLIDEKSGVIEKSGSPEEEGIEVFDMPEFKRDVLVRNGQFNGKRVKEYSIKARDGSALWMAVSFNEVREDILAATIRIGTITITLLTITVLIVFLLVRKLILEPLVMLMEAFDKLKQKNYDTRLSQTRIIEVQKTFSSFNQMAKKVQEAEEKMEEELKRAKQLDRMKSEFISIAAHQLRTPLSAVKWTMKMLIDGDIGTLSHEQKTFLTQGYISNERIINLVNDLLNVARIEEGRFGYKFTRINMEDLIESVVRDFTHKVRKKSIKFTYNKSGISNPPKINMDPTKIRMVIHNLIDNAIKYTPEDGEVTVTVKYSKMEVGISVQDTGMGIPEDQHKRLFTKFFRSNNAIKAQTEGTGLGLFIVKNIIEKHRGKIWCESEENKGTIFYFTVPI